MFKEKICCNVYYFINGISTLLLFFETNDKYIYKDVASEETLLNKENEDVIITPSDSNFTEENQANDS